MNWSNHPEDLKWWCWHAVIKSQVLDFGSSSIDGVCPVVILWMLNFSFFFLSTFIFRLGNSSWKKSLIIFLFPRWRMGSQSVLIFSPKCYIYFIEKSPHTEKKRKVLHVRNYFFYSMLMQKIVFWLRARCVLFHIEQIVSFCTSELFWLLVSILTK